MAARRFFVADTIHDPDKVCIYYLVGRKRDGDSGGHDIVDRVTEHVDLNGALSARVYPALDPQQHIPLGLGFADLDAAVRRVGKAFDTAGKTATATA